MEVALQEALMARPKGRPKKSERDDVSVKLDRSIVGMAKVIATSRGIPLAELLSEILDGPISRAYAVRMQELKDKK